MPWVLQYEGGAFFDTTTADAIQHDAAKATPFSNHALAQAYADEAPGVTLTPYLFITRNDVDQLKHNWICDPCFDIEDTEGFEEYHDELLTFSILHKEQWDLQAVIDEAEAEKIELRERLSRLNKRVWVVTKAREHVSTRIRNLHTRE